VLRPLGRGPCAHAPRTLMHGQPNGRLTSAFKIQVFTLAI
jgi:hypothetical protein